MKESKDLRLRAIMDDDEDFDQTDALPVRESQGDLTIEMLSGAMPKKALEANQRSPSQHPGESYLPSMSDPPSSYSHEKKQFFNALSSNN